MRQFTFITVFNIMRYVLIIVFIFSHLACTFPVPEEAKPTIQPIHASSEYEEHTSQIMSPKTEKIETEQEVEQEIAYAQQNLDLLGYEVGKIDGILTPETQSALRIFQKEYGLPTTGELTPSTFQVLEQAVQRQQQLSEQREVVKLRPPAPTQKDRKKKKKKAEVTTRKKTTPSSPKFTNIQKVGVYQVAAYLAEMGYFQKPLKQAKLKEVTAALKLFQRDIKVSPTVILDEMTLNKLKSIKLSRARQSELEAIIGKEETSTYRLPSEKSSAISMVTEPRVKQRDPAMPSFSLSKDESVFVIDRIECKSKHEAFILFYQGQLQQLQSHQVHVRVDKRYALWYDLHKEGVSDKHWWCIPKKRFCSSNINFTDWRGKLKPKEVGQFKKKWAIPSRLGSIVPLVAQSAKQVCSF
jgi:peptidoglycan hydrolase-like protein with peptidoglycan-binding domain